MNEEVLKQLSFLATKLGTTVEHLWGVLVVQARYEVIGTVLQLLVLCAVTYALYLSVKKIQSEDDTNDFLVPVSVALIFSYSITLIFFLICIQIIINCIFNPEYWALTQILRR